MTLVPPGPYDAVLVLSFGGPEGPDDVMPFLRRVTIGRGVPDARLAEVAAHYQLFGGVSPINAATRALVDALSHELKRSGPDLPVYWGNRNWHPLLADTARRMADDGVRRAVCFVTSAYGGYSSCRQYLEDIAAARAVVGDRAPVIDKLRPYYDHPGFIEPFAENVTRTLLTLDPDLLPDALLVFTAHSVPLAQAASSDYARQVEEASRLVASRVDGGPSWHLAWQSRSGRPDEPWLEPDVSDRLDQLAGSGVAAVVVVPIGFVADHMEVVYDLDVVAASRAKAAGLSFGRAATVGTAGPFVHMISELIAERTDPHAPTRRLGQLEARPAECSDGCCPPPTRDDAGRSG